MSRVIKGTKGIWVNGAGETAHPWSAKEVALLGYAFIDLDLDGPDLHQWCKANGVDRTPGAIDVKLRDLRFFDDTLPPRLSRMPRASIRHGATLRDKAEEMKLAKRNLALQIKLAKLEAAAGVPPYKGVELS